MKIKLFDTASILFLLTVIFTLCFTKLSVAADSSDYATPKKGDRYIFSVTPTEVPGIYFAPGMEKLLPQTDGDENLPPGYFRMELTSKMKELWLDEVRNNPLQKFQIYRPVPDKPQPQTTPTITVHPICSKIETNYRSLPILKECLRPSASMTYGLSQDALISEAVVLAQQLVQLLARIAKVNDSVSTHQNIAKRYADGDPPSGVSGPATTHPCNWGLRPRQTCHYESSPDDKGRVLVCVWSFDPDPQCK